MFLFILNSINKLFIFIFHSFNSMIRIIIFRHIIHKLLKRTVRTQIIFCHNKQIFQFLIINNISSSFFRFCLFFQILNLLQILWLLIQRFRKIEIYFILLSTFLYLLLCLLFYTCTNYFSEKIIIGDDEIIIWNVIICENACVALHSFYAVVCVCL